MNSSLIFHIGLEKTGTTSFQKFCAEQTSILEALGIYYPKKDFLFSGSNHCLLAASYLDKSILDFVPATSPLSHDSAVSGLVEDIESGIYDKILLSCEHFSSRFSDYEVEKIARDFGCYQPKIIILIRDHYSLIRAAYSTSLNSGDRSTFAMFLDDRLNPKEDIPDLWRGIYYRFLRFREIIQPWIKYFGKDNVVLLKYRKDANVIEEIFSEVLGSQFYVSPSHCYSNNQSIDPGLMEYVRIFNTVTPYWGELHDAGATNYWSYVGNKRSKFISIMANIESLPLVPAMDCLAEDSYQQQINNVIALDKEWLASHGFDLATSPPPPTNQETVAVSMPSDCWIAPQDLAGYIKILSNIDSLGTPYGTIIHALQQAVENAQREISNSRILNQELQEGIISKQKLIEHSECLVQNLGRQLNEVIEQSNEVTEQLNEATAQLKYVTEQLSDVYNSTSWRITKPIRIFGGYISLIIKKLKM